MHASQTFKRLMRPVSLNPTRLRFQIHNFSGQPEHFHMADGASSRNSEDFEKPWHYGTSFKLTRAWARVGRPPLTLQPTADHLQTGSNAQNNEADL